MFYEEFINYLPQKFPYLADIVKSNPSSPYLFNNNPITIGLQDLDKIKSFINSIYKLRNTESYQQDILGHAPHTKQYSILMSFDFHITQSGAKLIEINTNASHFLTSYYWVQYLEEKHGLKTISEKNAIELFLQSLHQEMQLYHTGKSIETIAIVDEHPAQQKAYSEFLMYKNLLQTAGYSVSILDIKDLTYDQKQKKMLTPQNNPIDFIYNRHTDFFLENENSHNLKNAYLDKAVCVSPTPDEYILLADKFRLVDFTKRDFLKKYLSDTDSKNISDCLLDIFEINEKSKDELWQNRKKYFFKPMNSHGSKGVYDGNKITRNTLDQIYVTKVYLAQEIAKPKTISMDISNKASDVKYDLRFYVYAGKIHHAIARTYIGQTTNFQTLGCGFSPVLLK